MSKDRLTKKDLKTNELEHALEEARDYVVSHEDQAKRWTAAGIGAAVLVAAVWGGISWRSRSLDGRLSTALTTLDAPLAADGVPATPGLKVFKDAAERTAEAKKELKDLAGSSSQAGRAARLVLLSLEGGTPSGTNLDGARDLASSLSGSIAGGFAAVAYLDGMATAGRTKDAIAAAQKYLSDSSAPAPKDVLLYTLGRLQEKAGQPVEARASYQRLVADFPDSPMRYEAQQKLQGI